jgi:hypothetical protein
MVIQAAVCAEHIHHGKFGGSAARALGHNQCAVDVKQNQFNWLHVRQSLPHRYISRDQSAYDTYDTTQNRAF